MEEEYIGGRLAEEDGDNLGDDEVPDWNNFAKYAKSFSANPSSNSNNNVNPFIPRRGEKDFTPSTDPNSNLFNSQTTLLSSSRSALFSALSAGERNHSSKAHNSATWRPDLGRASFNGDGKTIYGTVLHPMGYWSSERKRIELRPEEAIYLIERGVLECWIEGEETHVEKEDRTVETIVPKVPMSVQHAYAEMIGADGLTLEKYQVYAYLKRLGYNVLRASHVDSLQQQRDSFSLIAPLTLGSSPERGPRHNSILQFPLSILRLCARAAFFPFQFFWPEPVTNSTSNLEHHSAKKGKVNFTDENVPLLGRGREWSSYADMFTALRLVKTGHDLPLKSKLDDLESNAENDSSLPYQIFYYVYKPNRKFKKTAPPEPDFRLAIVNARITPLPTIFDLSNLFAKLPKPPPKERPSNSGDTNLRVPRKGQPTSPQVGWTKRFLYWLWGLFRISQPQQLQLKLPRNSPYPPLKTGRRSIVIAAVENGAMSFLRFSESEFGKHPMVGEPDPEFPNFFVEEDEDEDGLAQLSGPVEIGSTAAAT